VAYFDGVLPGNPGNKSFGPEAPKEWLFEVVKSLELSWASDGQEEALASVVEQLVAGLQHAPTAVRMGQALVVRPELPDARTRPSISVIRDLVLRKSPTTAQSPDGVRWCQVAAASAAGVATLKGVDAWKVISSVFRERDQPWARKLLNPAVARAQAAALEGGWTNVRFPDDVRDQPMDPDIARTLSVMPYPKFALAVNFQTKNYDLDEIRQGSIRPIAQRLNDMSLSSVDAINRLGHWIAQVESQLRGSAETNALWWGQSLYSIRRGVSYREIPANELLVLMADELLDAAGGQVSESVIAFYVETARRLIHDLDGERSWADHGARLNLTPQGASPVSPGLRGLVSEEATGLPFTFLATGGQPARIAEATMVHERTIGGRAWARQVFRERQLNRWFSAAMDT